MNVTCRILSTIIVDCVSHKFVLSHFRENGLENVITLVKGKAEAVTLPVDKVNLKKKTVYYYG